MDRVSACGAEYPGSIPGGRANGGNMNRKQDKKERATGKYIYDKKLGRVVKVSDEITGLKKSSNDNSCSNGSCGCSSCGL